MYAMIDILIIGSILPLHPALSDIVFQKTRGNPFFALSFLKSLHEQRLLDYCDRKRRWVWDEDRITALDVTGNVLHLLVSKMHGLSEDVQSALKVVSCFGTKMKASIAEYLSATSQYSNVLDGLEESCKLGLMIKVGCWGWRLVHDKVREAASTLVLDCEKNQVSICL